MAKVFLESTDTSYTVSNSNTQLYGASGDQTVVINTGATRVEVDQNIEGVRFAGNVGSFMFRSSGTNLEVLAADGTTLVARVPLQMDANGSTLQFDDATFATRLQTSGANAGRVTLNDTVVSNTATPSVVTPSEPTEPTEPTEPSGLLELAQAQERVEAGVGTIATTASPYVNALLSEDAWTQEALTYSMEAVMPTEYAQNPDLSDGWQPLTTTEQGVVRDAFTSFNALLDMRFTEVGSGGDIRLSAVRTDANVSGFAYPPFGANALAGDVFLDVNGRTTLDYYDNGNYGRSVVVHELGHALGLKHPFEEPIVLPTAVDNLAHTVMTYTHSQYVTHHFTYSNGVYESFSEGRYPDQFSLLDVHALQALYGANTSTRTGNDTYTYADIDRTGYLTIWDAGGQDTLDVSGAPGRSVVDLRGGNYSSVGLHTTQELVQAAVDDLVAQGGSRSFAYDWVNRVLTRADVEPDLYTGENNLAIVQGVWLENLYTGAGNDAVYDNGVNNRIFTADGNDTIYLGAGGFDYVDAGAGLDTVVLDSLSTQVQRESQADGSLLLVSDSFAAQLVGVEQLQFSDMTWSA